MYVHHRNISNIIKDFFLNLPFGERGRFLWLAGVCAITWLLWGEQNSRVFRGLDRDS